MDIEKPGERNSKDDDASSRRMSLGIDKAEKDALEPKTDHRILFAPDPREKTKHHDEIGILPLTRTFSRNSYSAASDKEAARVKRVTSGKAADPGNVLPIGNCIITLLTLRIPNLEHQCYREHFTQFAANQR
jgi:hypothetical protein